jgi:hypothetical protein
MVSRSGNQKGGGYGSRQHVEKPVRTGSGSHSTRPAGATNIGLMYGTHSTNQRREGDFRGGNFVSEFDGLEVALGVVQAFGSTLAKVDAALAGRSTVKPGAKASTEQQIPAHPLLYVATRHQAKALAATLELEGLE